MMTTNERELLLSLAKVLIDGAGVEERVKIDRLREAVEKEGTLAAYRLRGEVNAMKSLR